MAQLGSGQAGPRWTSHLREQWVRPPCYPSSSASPLARNSGPTVAVNTGVQRELFLWSQLGPQLGLLSMCLCSGCSNKISRTGGAYRPQKIIPPSSRGWEVQDQGISMVTFCWERPSWFIAGVFSLCPHMWKGRGVFVGSLVSGTNPVHELSTLMT